jgi:tRNA U34 5-carboxymethylaminomethyl modifying enzyme MnmG/GidA
MRISGVDPSHISILVVYLAQKAKTEKHPGIAT